jgi:predicted GNAT family acetyltransferase
LIAPNRQQALEMLRATLAADYACDPACFDRDQTIVVEARILPGRRRFPIRAKALTLLTTGRGALISCSAARLAWVQADLAQRSRQDLFSFTTLAQINEVVARDGQTLDGPFPRYLCASDTLRAVAPPAGIRIELIERAEIERAYACPGFDNALSYQLDQERPDMVAVIAWQSGAVVGMAGASADNDLLWQIGVDVLPPHQGRGIGKALVSRLSAAVLAAGRTPYYATRIDHLHSSKTALSVGYWLAWLDAYVYDR